MVQVFNINGNRKKQKKKIYIYIQEITKPHNFVNKSFALQKYEKKVERLHWDGDFKLYLLLTLNIV